MRKDLLIITGDLHHHIPRKRLQSLVHRARHEYKLTFLYAPFCCCLRDGYALDSADPSFIYKQLSSFITAQALEHLYLAHLAHQRRHFQKLFCLLDFIDAYEYEQLFNSIFSIKLQQLETFSFERVPVGQLACRDLSLVHHLSSPLDTSNADIHLFYRLTVFICCLVVLSAQKLLLKLSFPLKSSSSRCILPDHYSPYLSVEHYLSRATLARSMILSADHVFDNHLKIMRPDLFFEEKLSSYRLQQCGAEYATPEQMFNFVQAYISRKILSGKSNQMFSPGKSTNVSLVDKLNHYTSKFSKNIIYYTSSPDEQLNEEFIYPFKSLQSGAISKGIVLYDLETDFLRDVIKFCISNDIGLVIRIHPRMTSRHDCVLPSGLTAITEALSEDINQHCLVVNPEDQISSYWLASLADLSLFYWSTIGIELMMLGFSALAPNAANSYTYYGYPFMHNAPALTPDAFFQEVHSILLSGSPNYLLASAVRSFSIECLASQFIVPDYFCLFGFRFKFYFRRGFLPWLNISKLPSYAGSIVTSRSSSSTCVTDLIQNCSSLKLPHRMGYWLHNDYKPVVESYIHWLSTRVHPELGISESITIKLLKGHLMNYDC